MADTQPSPNRLISVTTWATLIALGLAALLGVWLKMGLIGADRFSIEWLEVSGSLQRTSASQVRAAAGPHASQGYFAMELANVRKAVEALPWVSQAQVSRAWPDTLLIEIKEHQPMARWNQTGVLSGLQAHGGALLTIDGSEDIQGLVRLYGPEGQHNVVLEAWMEMRSDLASAGLHMEALRLDERGAWTLTLSNGIELLLGREHRDQRLARFVGVHEYLRTQSQRAERVDMRYANGMAVEWIDANREQGRRG